MSYVFASKFMFLWIITYCKKTTNILIVVENHMSSIPGMVQDRWKFKLFTNIDWQSSALQKGKICFSSFVLLFLVNNILDFGSGIFYRMRASLGKNESFTEKKRICFWLVHNYFNSRSNSPKNFSLGKQWIRKVTDTLNKKKKKRCWLLTVHSLFRDPELRRFTQDMTNPGLILSSAEVNLNPYFLFPFRVSKTLCSGVLL